MAGPARMSNYLLLKYTERKKEVILHGEPATKMVQGVIHNDMINQIYQIYFS